MKNLRFKGIFLANHNQDTGLRFWDIELWKREITDLKAMGVETIWYLPIQFGQRKPEDLTAGSEHMQLQVAISEAIHEAGLKVGIYQGLNDVFPQTLEAHPDWKAEEGKYFLEEAHASPSIPEAWMEIMRLRRMLFSQLPYVDYLITPATDYGGDGSEACAPWPLTYLKCFEEQVSLLKEYHPAVQVVAAGHGLPLDELDLLRSELPSKDWIDYVADIPRGAGKPVIKYYMYPEITMLSGWGLYGASPCLEVIQKLYREESGAVEAVVPYSEGVHDDINKFASLKFAENPSLSSLEVASEYSSEWLRLQAADAERFAEIILTLGNLSIHDYIYVDATGGLEYPEHDAAIEWLDALRSRETSLNENLRFWLLFYRAICESMCQPEGDISPERLTALATECRESFLRLEPSYGAFINTRHPKDRPGVQPWVWPRTACSAWRREREFDAKA